MTKLMQLLTADMGIATTPVGAYLDPSTALYLKLARAHGCLHYAVRTPQLFVSFDAKKMYGRLKCYLLSVHLPQACQPRQLLLQLPLARYLDQDDHIKTSSQFECMDLLPALEKALESGCGGESMGLVFCSDYAAYYQTTGTPPPTADCCCVECYGSKDLWKQLDWIRQSLQDFHNYTSRCAPFFRLMKCRLTCVYDVHHCNNHVLANRVINPLWFWTRANLPEEYTVQWIRATSLSCRHPVASLSPPRRCFGTFSPLTLPCRLPVALLSLSCRSPVAPLSLPCRFPVALLSLSCRFLSLPVVSCRHANFCLAPSCRSPVALLSFPPVALLSLFPVASLSPSCRLPVVFLPPPCRLPVASLSPPCRPMW